MTERLLSTEDLAAYLQVPLQTIYKWRRLGTGPVGFRVGKHVRYSRGAVDEWLSERADAPRSA